MMEIKDCQEISNALSRILADARRANNRIEKAAQEMRSHMMPYIAKVRADDWISQAKLLLKGMEEDKKIIDKLLKQERKAHE